MKLVFGKFLPDLPEHASPGVSEAINLYPGPNGFRPVGQFIAHTEALPLPCKGASAFVSPAGRQVIIAGTAEALYRQEDLGWTEISDGYALGDEDRWRFVQFGPIAIVSNGIDPPLKVNLETDSVADLGGTPPTMQAMAVVSNFVVGTQTEGQVNRIAWSGENNAEWWTYAQRKSDYNDFPDGGEVTGVVGGEIGLILQRNAVRRMAYVGGNVLFRFDKISTNFGCATVHSVAQHGDLAFWYAETGFKMWDGAQIKSIGFQKVDESFGRLYGLLDYSKLSTTVDGQRNIVCWSTGYKMWLYNWLLDAWTVIDYAAEIITARAGRVVSLDERDPAVGVNDDTIEYPGLDDFDTARFIAGDPIFYVFAGGAMGTFNGENMAARVAGRVLEIVEGRDARLQRIRPMTDAVSGITVRLDTKQRLGDGATRRDFTTLQSSGEMPVRARGRFTKGFIDIAADNDWTYLQGLDATLAAGGSR